MLPNAKIPPKAIGRHSVDAKQLAGSAASAASPWASLIEHGIGGIVSVITGGQKAKLEKFKNQQASNRNLTNAAISQHNKRQLLLNQRMMDKQQQKGGNNNLLIFGLLGFVALIILVLIFAFRS